VISKLLLVWVLVALCVVIHAAGVTLAMPWVRGYADRQRRFLHWTWLFVRLAGWVIFLHLIEIAVWGWFYEWQRALPDLQTALYFSAVTYTTTGYGDVVLPSNWRLEGGIEALTGILMCGWSTGFFFAVLSRMLREPLEPSANSSNL
jgi:Ion channel